MSKKTLYLTAYLYLFIPICIFFLAGIKYYFSIPIIGLSLYSLYHYYKSIPDTKLSFDIDKKKMLFIIGIIFLWVLLSGIGGFTWQNRWDHMFRNALFHDLVKYDWPVEKDIRICCYYFGYWLPSALMGKLFNSITIGYLFQFIYGFIGIIIVFLLISEFMKRLSYKVLFIFILFSGLDILMFIKVFHDFEVLYNLTLDAIYIELYLVHFISVSNTSMLFWGYNQIIPFWIGFMLIILQKDSKYLFFTYSLLMLFSPFPLFALIPAMIYLEFRKKNLGGLNMKEFIKSIITIPNIAGLLMLIVIALFYKTNLATNKLGMVPFTSENVLRFFIYLFIEYAVFIVFVYKEVKNDYLFYILMGTMLVCSLFKLGIGSDFAARTCMPAVFYLMLIVSKYILNGSPKELRYRLLMFVLVLGAFTPFMEISRTLQHTIFYEKFKEPFLSDGLDSVFEEENNACYVNFIGKKDSFFCKYIMR